MVGHPHCIEDPLFRCDVCQVVFFVFDPAMMSSNVLEKQASHLPLQWLTVRPAPRDASDVEKLSRQHCVLCISAALSLTLFFRGILANKERRGQLSEAPLTHAHHHCLELASPEHSTARFSLKVLR
jgi:hypothetical protein